VLVSTILLFIFGAILIVMKKYELGYFELSITMCDIVIGAILLGYFYSLRQPIENIRIRKFSQLYYYYSLGIMVLGLFFALAIKDSQLQFSMSFGFFSIGLAFMSISMAYSSDRKMSIIANNDFLKIVEEFEELRITLYQDIYYNKEYRGILTACLKLFTYIERAIYLKNNTNIEKDNQSKLYGKFFLLIHWTVLPWDGVVLKNVQYIEYGITRYKDIKVKMETKVIILIEKMAESISQLDLDDVQRKEFNEILEFIQKHKK